MSVNEIVKFVFQRTRQHLGVLRIFEESNLLWCKNDVWCKTYGEKEDRGHNGDVGIEGNSGSDGKSK